jgi:MHS family shikimate/dehydroshikimate transporter-like MFS transporter
MVGAIADWYDYFLYGTAAALVVGPLYFPGSVGKGALAAFATFAIGFFFRPLGSIFFGHFGDRVGRKNMLILTMVLMGASSTLIGLLPTFAQIGIAAPILLVVFRALQGFAVGGEWGGAALMAVESAPNGEKAFRGSVVQSGAFIGLLLANGAFLLFSTVLSDAAFLSWGWRVPFLLSVVILAVGYWVRRGTYDSPEFERVKREGRVEKFPLWSALKAHPKSFFIIVGMFIGPNVATYMVLTFAISYGTTHAGVGKTVFLVAQMIASAVCLVTIPALAKYGDRSGWFRTYVIGAVVVIVFSLPFFWILDSGSTVAIVLATIVMLAIGATAQVAVQQPIFTQMFDAKFRYSGAGFAYQFGAAIGGISPLLSTFLVQAGGGSGTGPAVYMAGIALVTLLTTIAVRKQIRTIQFGEQAPSGGQQPASGSAALSS